MSYKTIIEYRGSSKTTLCYGPYEGVGMSSGKTYKIKAKNCHIIIQKNTPSIKEPTIEFVKQKNWTLSSDKKTSEASYSILKNQEQLPYLSVSGPVRVVILKP